MQIHVRVCVLNACTLYIVGIYGYVILKDGVVEREEETVDRLKNMVRSHIGGFAVPETLLVCVHVIQVVVHVRTLCTCMFIHVYTCTCNACARVYYKGDFCMLISESE